MIACRIKGSATLCRYRKGTRSIGFIETTAASMGCYVENIEVDPKHQGRGVGTRLWQAAAASCWRARGLPLRSGNIVSSNALAFWEKQYRKGRATRTYRPPAERPEGRDDFYNEYRYKLKTPPPASLTGSRR